MVVTDVKSSLTKSKHGQNVVPPHDVPLLAEELLSVDSYWEKHSFKNMVPEALLTFTKMSLNNIHIGNADRIQ